MGSEGVEPLARPPHSFQATVLQTAMGSTAQVNSPKVAREGLEPSRPKARPSEDRVSAIPPSGYPNSTLGGIRTRDLRIESPAATPQAPRGRPVAHFSNG